MLATIGMMLMVLGIALQDGFLDLSRIELCSADPRLCYIAYGAMGLMALFGCINSVWAPAVLGAIAVVLLAVVMTASKVSFVSGAVNVGRWAIHKPHLAGLALLLAFIMGWILDWSRLPAIVVSMVVVTFTGVEALLFFLRTNPNVISALGFGFLAVVGGLLEPDLLNVDGITLASSFVSSMPVLGESNAARVLIVLLLEAALFGYRHAFPLALAYGVLIGLTE